MTTPIGPTILEYLTDLETSAAAIAKTWRPDDPAYRAELYQQTMMNLSGAYFPYFGSTPEHPDFSPIYNPAYMLQPNPDDIYIRAPLNGKFRYRLSGNRGTCRLLSFTTQRGESGVTADITTIGGSNAFDHRDLEIAPNGDFEVILSTERPEGWTGNWQKIDPTATNLLVRQRMYDWGNEVDPRLSIENLDVLTPKPRRSPEDILEGIREMARYPGRRIHAFYGIQNGVKDRVGFNVFELVQPKGWLAKQSYWQGCFRFAPDEAIVIETEMPKQVHYWNLQVNDPLFNAVDYVYRLSCTNGHYAKLSPDGKFRAVISLEDCGVPNWLDPGGYTEGGLYGRWYDSDTTPHPTMKVVKLSEVRAHLPADTPVVTPAERIEEVRERTRACQRRKRW